jgi:hypothetical protein
MPCVQCSPLKRIATLAHIAHYTMFSPQNPIWPHDLLKDAPWKDHFQPKPLTLNVSKPLE